MREVKLTPSDFAFLYQECPRCVYNKVMLGITPPRSEFAPIFSKIDSRVKRHFVTREALEAVGIEGYTPLLYPPVIKGALLECKDLGLAARLEARPDAIWLHDSGRLHVPDFKTTEVKDDSLFKYSRQNHAYAYCIENPLEPDWLKAQLGVPELDVEGVSLLCWEPDALERDPEISNRSHLGGPWTHVPLPFDRASFLIFVREVLQMCADGPPVAAGKCSRCLYVAKLEGAKPQQMQPEAPKETTVQVQKPKIGVPKVLRTMRP